MREIRTYGLIRGGCREAVAYFLTSAPVSLRFEKKLTAGKKL